ncbi:MAG: hypothetical protein JEZ06_08790 [Anaerolineaceae bacterium]|nr:hypothetical protein [Anaerolineaceae bacterium]
MDKKIIVVIGLFVMIFTQGCLASVFSKMGRYAEIEREREAQQQEKESRLSTAIANGQKDFFQIAPINSNTFSIEFDQSDIVYNPKCSAVYHNYPGLVSEEPEELEKLVQNMRQVSDVDISRENAIGPHDGYNGVFYTVFHEKGQDVFYQLFGPVYYVNGKCTMQ